MNIKEFFASKVTVTHGVYILTLVLAVSVTLNGVFLLAPAPHMQTFADIEQPLTDHSHQVYHSAIIESPQAHEPLWQQVHEQNVEGILKKQDVLLSEPKH
jgi:hypothetical protein